MKTTLKELRSFIRVTIAEAPGRFGRSEYVPPPVDGTISLPTDSAIALWKGEILGQLSDGMWENTRPHNHWRFWHDLKVVKGPPQVTVNGSGRPEKNTYNLAALIPILGERMIKIGRLGSVGAVDTGYAGEYMPATLEEWEAGKGKEGYKSAELKKITPEVAKAYYASRYSDKDMRNDLRSIKAALKSIRTWNQ